VLENRLIKQWRPPGNKALKRTDRWAYVRVRLDIEYPVLEVSSEPATGRAVNIGPIRGKALAQDLADHLTSLYRLRHCGRRMHRRDHPSIYGQMGRCCSPCLGDLDPNAYRRQVEKVLALFEAPDGAAQLLLAEIDQRMAAASRGRHYEAAAALLRRRERLEGLLDRLDGVLRAVHSDPRLVVARHPVKDRFDALWLVQGRVADWGPLPVEPAEVAARSRAVLDTSAARPDVGAEEVDEVRIAAAWVAEHRPPTLELEQAADPGRLERFLRVAAATAG
jgi:DNA polymerase-3 subunit epsilon